ncbi:MAG: glucose PTS transporter subunit IIA [Lachnospiraceae bacterium]
MNYQSIAKQTLKIVGGKENIISAAHCATRLRLVIADNARCSREQLEEVEGVKGVFEAQGQLQIIFGTGTVNKVYAEFIKAAGITEATKDEVKQAAAAKQNLFKRAVKTLGDIFVPIIPAIVASGLLMGLLEGLCNAWPAMADSSAYMIFHLFSNAAFVFLPVLIAISAAKTFGGNLFLGAVIGMIMIHPDLLNAWSVSGMDPSQIPTASAWFGLYDINLVGYQGHVIPVVIAVWLMSLIEKKLHKIVPEVIDLFVTPLVTVMITGYVTLTMIGPLFSAVENYVLNGAEMLIQIPFGIGAALVGAVYAPTVVAGLHHMYNAIEAGMISATGLNIWMPIATAANVAQGAACLAVALKSKNRKTKAIAVPAALSSYLGITEPAIFGVNVRYMKPFIAGCIGGAAGALVAGVLHVGATAYGITGIFGFLITTNCAVSYALVMITATVVAFALSWILYREENTESDEKKAKTETRSKTKTEKQAEILIGSPLEGKTVPLEEVNDPTFAEGMLGKGIAVIPESGVITAPFDGKAEMVFPTKHAVALVDENGVEVMIHIGIDTVKLNGQYFEAFVEQGAEVKKGQKLLAFDNEAIQKAGYETVTMVLVTNSDQFESVEAVKQGQTARLEEVIRVRTQVR